MLRKVYRLALGDHSFISRLIKQDYHVEKMTRRGNVIWALARNDQNQLEVRAFLVIRDIAGWLAKEIQSWGNKYFTCPLSYIDAAEVVPNDPVYRVWVQALRGHYAEIGKKRRLYNQQRKKIAIGDLIRLGYRNLPQGFVIKLDPLTVIYENHTYANISMKVFKGWIAHAREKAKQDYAEDTV